LRGNKCHFQDASNTLQIAHIDLEEFPYRAHFASTTTHFRTGTSAKELKEVPGTLLLIVRTLDPLLLTFYYDRFHSIRTETPELSIPRPVFTARRRA
jgi:hypothetical protein